MTIPAADYHQDLTGDERPSLSSSIAKLLVNASPAHAFIAHPKLNPAFAKRDDEAKFELGTVVHDLFLEGVDRVAVCDFDDWRTKAAQENREVARAAGRIPMLSKHYEAALMMVESIRDQLEVHPASPPLFCDGKAEQTLVWSEGDVLCRARLDWLHDSHLHIDDLKSTARSASAKAWTRSSLFANGYDLQAAFYIRGVRAVYGVEATWRWCVVETAPPYGLSVITPGEDVLAIGDAKVTRALELWRDCLEAGVWPAYPAEVVVAEAPAWETRWLMTPELEEMAWAQM